MTDTTEMTEKPKKQMSEERLAQLAAARKKALEKRRQLAELTKKEKEIKERELQERVQRVQDFEKKVSAPKAKKAPPPPPVESESDEDSESESEEHTVAKNEWTDYEPPKPKKHAPPKPMAQPKAKPDHALAADIARQELKKRIQEENMRIAYRSLFPGVATLHFD